MNEYLKKLNAELNKKLDWILERVHAARLHVVIVGLRGLAGLPFRIPLAKRRFNRQPRQVRKRLDMDEILRQRASERHRALEKTLGMYGSFGRSRHRLRRLFGRLF